MNPIDLYISNIKDPLERDTLEKLRKTILEILPDSVECISYCMPAFKVHGKAVAGFAAFKNHLSFFPFSGSILSEFALELTDFTYTKSGIHFTPEKPIPRVLLEKIISKRLHTL
ncbi:DUF1801 domain-containing protein [Candidatus Gracilibacteria bacterium]|nr:DUF1801 domain-containing protein [Candidatus Gracilibacteria bacterium]